MLAAVKSYDEEELEQRANHAAFAARADKSAHAVDNASEEVGPSAVHGEPEAIADNGMGSDFEESDGRILYFFRPLETKHLRETIPAIKRHRQPN